MFSRILKLILSFSLFLESPTLWFFTTTSISIIARAEYIAAEGEDECDHAISRMDQACGDSALSRYAEEENNNNYMIDALSTINKYKSANGKYINSCEAAVEDCKNSCSDESGQSACSAGENKLENAKKAQDEASKSGEGAEALLAILGALGPLLGMLKKDKKKHNNNECKTQDCKKVEIAEDKNPKSASGKLARSGYRQYPSSSGESSGGSSLSSATNGPLTTSKGNAGSASNSSSGGAGNGGVSFGNSGSSRGFGSFQTNNNPPDEGERFDTQIGEGFYGTSGSGGGGKSGSTGEGGGSQQSSAFSKNVAGMASVNSSAKQISFNGVINKAKSMLRLPSSAGASNALIGDAYGDNFMRVHEKYRVINDQEKWED